MKFFNQHMDGINYGESCLIYFFSWTILSVFPFYEFDVVVDKNKKSAIYIAKLLML